MRGRHVPLKPSPGEASLLGLLLLLLLLGLGLAVCPSVCTCSRSHREVDCSWRGLRQLPAGLQHNVHSLNLSHNRLHELDGRLTAYTHLRVLDLSHNRLGRLPAGLPRSLWRLLAASNRLQLLGKNDTVHQWNLRALDLSANRLERAVFINNTLSSLCALNLSRNHLRTVPTNIPARLEAVDLSHNLLARVLPGSLDRLPRLSHLYLHANRFAALPPGVLDRATALRVVTLGDNPWACHLDDEVGYLVSWAQRTPARVLGCPCHTRAVCGGAGRPGGGAGGGGWHFASYNLPPLAASARALSSPAPPEPPEAGVTGWWYLSASSSSLLSTPHTPTGSPPGSPHLSINHLSATTSHALHADSRPASGAKEAPPTDAPCSPDAHVTETAATLAASPSTRTKKTTTLRTRSVRRQNQSPPNPPPGGRSGGPPLASRSLLPLLHGLGLLSLTLQRVL